MADMDGQLLAQDDIDALLGEAGLEGGYQESPIEEEVTAPTKSSSIKFAKVSDDEARFTMAMLRSKAMLDREDDIRIIWNAEGCIPLSAGLNMTIQESDYVTLGVLHTSHLVVRTNLEGQD